MAMGFLSSRCRFQKVMVAARNIVIFLILFTTTSAGLTRIILHIIACYLTIIRRRRGDYRGIFAETKSR
jgi:hypothetical protein